MYIYLDGYILEPDQIFRELHTQCQLLFEPSAGQAKRLSCLFIETDLEHSLMYAMRQYDWSVCPIVQQIRRHFQTVFDTKLDYCLMHLYLDGDASIGYHSDREALNSMIISVSFGATRKFRFRKISDKIGYHTELRLKSGDVVIMKNTCQRYYKHTVPVEKKIKTPRINLTFRRFD